MLQTLSNSVIDWMLPTDDIKTAFNDIPTGHTPTNASDGSFRDFSKWENLNTPTPLDKEPDNYFIYPPNSTIKTEPVTEDDQSFPTRSVTEYYNDNNLQIFGVQYLKPLTECENNYVTQPSTPLVYCNLESYSASSTTNQEIKSEGQNDNLSLLSPITPVPNYNTNIIVDQWSTDTSLHPTKFTMDDMDSSIYACQYDNNSNNAVYTSLETHMPWTTTTYHNSNNNVTHSNTFTTTREYCCKNGISSELSLIHQNNNNNNNKQYPLKLSDQQKPFVCGMLNCNKRFVRIDELKRHQRTHSEIKQFVCDICKKGFTRSDHLMTHRRTHTGERPYECKLCDRRFARSDERNRHTKTHMRDKPRRGRKPRNANILPTGTTITTATTTPPLPNTTPATAPSTITSSTVVVNNFPTYNVLPCCSMKIDYPLECKNIPDENKSNIV
ncbi:unnamed protein product [Trichobilharzia regenti]|nr:unnamed protein product [Trichobilharzia regenti]